VLQTYPLYDESRPQGSNRMEKISGNSTFSWFSFSQVASSSVWLHHCTLYIFYRLFRVTFPEVSKIFTRYSWYVRSSPTITSSRGICSSETRKHFLSCETWKTSCTSNNCGGSSNWYAMTLESWMVQYILVQAFRVHYKNSLNPWRINFVID
jgi:hypothetical protein